MTGKIGLIFKDNSGELARVDINTDDLTNTTCQDIIDQSDPATAGTLAAAIAALTLCTPAGHDVMATKTSVAAIEPINKLAQREMGLLVSYQDTVNGNSYRITIPGPDWTNLGVTGSDKVNPANAAWTAFVLAFETWASSPLGNSVVVTGGRLVGRSR